MAHQVEKMVYVGEKPWHGLGKYFEVAPSLDQALIEAGLNWTVSTEPVFSGSQESLPAKLTRRSDNGKVLGVVGPSYIPLQNEEAKDWFKPFESAGFVEVETAGSLDEGRKVFFLCKIRENSILRIKGDDIVEKYVLLSNSHDGTLAVRVGFTPIRVVCANTLAIAHNCEASKLLRVKHTSGIRANLDQIRDIMNLANQAFEATADQYRFLASKEINSKDLEKYVKVVFCDPKAIIKADEDSKLGQRILSKVIPLFQQGRGNDMEGVKGTYWAAYNAVTEYLQHEKGDNAETRLDSAWFGQGVTTNKKALSVALQMAA